METFGKVGEVAISSRVGGRFAEEVFGVGIIHSVFEQPRDEFDGEGKGGGVGRSVTFAGNMGEVRDHDLGDRGLVDGGRQRERGGLRLAAAVTD